ERGHIDYRINQYLQCHGRSAVTRFRRDYRGHVGAGTVARNHNSLWIDAQRCRVFSYPACHIETVIQSRREFVFWSETIIDSDDHGTCTVRDGAADGVMRIQIAKYPAASVEENHTRKGPVSIRSVHSNRNFAAAPGNFP